MKVTLKCPACGSALPFEAPSPPESVACGSCQWTIPLHVTEALRADRAVDACPQCGGTDFYVRKDFDPKLGLTVVIIGVLGFAALIDLFVYGRLKDLTVCYRCHTEFRGGYTPTAPIFDLGTADELELEWAREVEKRGKSEGAITFLGL